jgi:hypothetical protein
MYDVTACEHRLAAAGWREGQQPSCEAFIQRHETIAYFALLCMEWGHSPDVIRMLSFEGRQPVAVIDWHHGHPRVGSTDVSVGRVSCCAAG